MRLISKNDNTDWHVICEVVMRSTVIVLYWNPLITSMCFSINLITSVCHPYSYMTRPQYLEYEAPSWTSNNLAAKKCASMPLILVKSMGGSHAVLEDCFSKKTRQESLSRALASSFLNFQSQSLLGSREQPASLALCFVVLDCLGGP